MEPQKLKPTLLNLGSWQWCFHGLISDKDAVLGPPTLDVHALLVVDDGAGVGLHLASRELFGSPCLTWALGSVKAWPSGPRD